MKGGDPLLESLILESAGLNIEELSLNPQNTTLKAPTEQPELGTRTIDHAFVGGFPVKNCVQMEPG